MTTGKIPRGGREWIHKKNVLPFRGISFRFRFELYEHADSKEEEETQKRTIKAVLSIQTKTKAFGDRTDAAP